MRRSRKSIFSAPGRKSSGQPLDPPKRSYSESQSRLSVPDPDSKIIPTPSTEWSGPDNAIEKHNEEIKLTLLEKEAAKQKAKKLDEHLQKIDYLKFPTILGWYFDGSFTVNFNLNEEYAGYFSEVAEEIEAKKDFEIDETFTERAYRNFWPPKFFGNFFRTRGVYLDFKETKEDPPKTPPEMNFERHNAVIGIGDGDNADEDEDKLRFGNVEFASASGRRGNDMRDKYYWTDETREFLLKEDDEEYEWSDHDKVWWKSSSVDRNPYSWFWHSGEGKFHIRNKITPDEYVFDQVANIFKKKGLNDYSKNGLGPHDYFYCENVKKWIPLSEAVEGETEEYKNGKREIKKGPRGATGLGPDDFYYSGESGKIEPKNPSFLHEYYYDIKDEMFKKQGEAYGPGKTGLYPTDYKFYHSAGDWEPKNPVELYKPSPYDWFFDTDKGRFYKLDKTQRDDYEFDQISNVWKMKGLKGPSANDLGPEDYVYDETTKDWKLESSFEPEQIEKHEAGKRKIKKGLRGKSGKMDDDFYYDSLLGEFLSKDKTKLGNYYYDTNCEVFRKRQQPYGPGTSQLLPKQYYFDEIEGKWMPTSEAKTILARNKQVLRLVGEQFQTAYDYAFDPYQGTFVLRDQNRPLDYEYNAESGVYYVRGIRGPSINGKKVGDYYFDEHVYNWLPLESPKGHEARDYKNGRRNNRIGPRGLSGFIPDDFYFTEGNFLEKDRFHPELYSFNPEIGVWKLIDPSPLDYAPSNNKHTDYFFSFEEGRFILKKDLKFGEIALDKNSYLWRQKLRIPFDYIWNGKNYVLKPAKPQPQVGISKSVTAGLKTAATIKEKFEEKAYDKPWLNNYPTLAADKKRYLQEIEKIKEKNTHQDDKSKRSSLTITPVADEKPKKKKKKPIITESNLKSSAPKNKNI